MGLVRFAEVCDGCDTRGPEYTTGFVIPCEECGVDLCRDCIGKVTKEADEGRPPVGLCKPCLKDQEIYRLMGAQEDQDQDR